jgi:hypothetical protein
VWNDGDYSKVPEPVSEPFVLIDPTIPEDVGPGPGVRRTGLTGSRRSSGGCVRGPPIPE